ncbi:hypothetical protein RDABS01_019820 [Bienertia sinuspersici]
MKRESKNGKPGRSKAKFASRFCMFPKVKSADSSPGFAPVYLNVYDLTPINGYMYWAGFGIFHTGVEGSVCNCVLPESLKASTVPEPHLEICESEKKHLRAFSCFSSFSINQKEESISSLFLHSHYRGCLPPWESGRTRSADFEEED